jgi:hypothetical protein
MTKAINDIHAHMRMWVFCWRRKDPMTRATGSFLFTNYDKINVKNMKKRFKSCRKNLEGIKKMVVFLGDE